MKTQQKKTENSKCSRTQNYDSL